jgi:maltose/moltooligosaccharide transporter
MKLDYRKTFLLGFGFLGVSVVWTFYNSFVPILLKGFITSNALIGLIMTFDNILAVTIQPIIGAASDKTKTKLGRRMPYLLIGAPLAAIFFALIPVAQTLQLLLILIILMNLAMALFRSPVIALMPDIFPSPVRSKANGVINFMGGAGALVAVFAGGALFNMNRDVPFIVIAAVMLVAIIVVYLTIKEPKNIPAEAGEDISWKLVKVSTIALAVGVVSFLILNKTGVLDSFLTFFKEDAIYQGHMLIALAVFSLIVFITILRWVHKSTIFIFLSIFFWFFGYNAVETFFTLYGVNTLGLKAGTASMVLGIFIITFIIFAIPSGFVATRFGRKKTIITGLLLMIVPMSYMAFTTSVVAVIAALFIAGIGWACVNINSFPMIWDISTEEMLGTYTGLYYFFSMLAQTVSPPVVGIFIDYNKGDYRSMFYIVPAFFVLALITMLFVKGGEAKSMTASDSLGQMEV